MGNWNTHAHGKRKVRGVMNGTENKFFEQYIFPRLQDGDVLEWWYEKWSWTLTERTPSKPGSPARPGTRYTPDFVCLLKSGEIVVYEVKGVGNARLQDLNRVKLFSDKFPIRTYVATLLRKKDGGGFNLEEY